MKRVSFIEQFEVLVSTRLISFSASSPPQLISGYIVLPESRSMRFVGEGYVQVCDSGETP